MAEALKRRWATAAAAEEEERRRRRSRRRRWRRRQRSGEGAGEEEEDSDYEDGGDEIDVDERRVAEELRPSSGVRSAIEQEQ